MEFKNRKMSDSDMFRSDESQITHDGSRDNGKSYNEVPPPDSYHVSAAEYVKGENARLARYFDKKKIILRWLS